MPNLTRSMHCSRQRLPRFPVSSPNWPTNRGTRRVEVQRPRGRRNDVIGRVRGIDREHLAMMDLDPRDVLADLFGSGDFPPEILLDPLHAAEVVVQRLHDAGFEIVPA
jgi:hypothetical protein